MTSRLKHLGGAIVIARTRIRDHSPLLRDSEFRTRLALIDPVLDALGWCVSDLRSVIVEYRDRNSGYGGRVDYALLREDGSPCIMIEAKRLGELGTSDLALAKRLTRSHVQMLSYADAAGIGTAALTDGDRWILYDLHRKGPLHDRVRFDIQVSQSSADESAEHLLELSRRRHLRSVHRPNPDQPHTPQNWILLAELDPRKKKPAAIQFSDGATSEVREIADWRSMVKEFLLWLERKHLLSGEDLSIDNNRAKRIMVHAVGKGHLLKHEIRVSPDSTIVFEGDRNARQLVVIVRQVLAHLHLDTKKVEIRVRLAE